jgi:hypothetical protein
LTFATAAVSAAFTPRCGNIRSVRVFNFTITEYEPRQTWVVVSTGRESVELEDDVDFHTWARERWPPKRYEVTLDREPFRWAAGG